MQDIFKEKAAQLLKEFEEAANGDKSKALVVILNNGGNVTLACSGTGSTIIDTQIGALVDSFKQVTINGNSHHFHDPMYAAGKIIAGVSRDLTLAAQEVSNGKA
ncbi:hypothetical protein [Shewanella phage vB_SbaS_Y11]|nr:hypothetical protein [Shewanella phage vB_SbaS_Y11]